MRANDWGFGFAGRAGRGGWGGFRWRPFERGDLKFVILRLLSDKPMHGYEVMQALEKESCGYYRASAGSVYPTLQMLEDQGYVRSEAADGRKVYHITDAGREYLKEHRDAVDEIFDRVSSFTDRFFGREMRDLSGAFSRLAQECFEGAIRWSNDPEVMAKIREILERAAREVEEARRSGRAGEAGEKGADGSSA
ncbi:MAG: PadR family transcriptional regulator [Gemmatimonadetes bacterium]|nr:PadR family transcriptional regulator [Gemmatimonadota bacterium]